MHSNKPKYKHLSVYLCILVLHYEESAPYIHHLDHTAVTLSQFFSHSIFVLHSG